MDLVPEPHMALAADLQEPPRMYRRGQVLHILPQELGLHILPQELVPHTVQQEPVLHKLQQEQALHTVQQEQALHKLPVLPMRHRLVVASSKEARRQSFVEELVPRMDRWLELQRMES